MPIWKTRSVSEESEITLTEWRIFEVDDGQRYFVGTRPETLSARVSSAIVKFDVASRKGITQTGRTYKLVGPPGFSFDSAYVWNAWTTIYKVENVKDVTLAMLDGDYLVEPPHSS
ncbi:hypothetical protein CR51_10205 [Caballeronia megalochromosomata]|nr:hypothetical protein CR51_10205 [Caballeronia megalochromosomata]